MEDKPVEDQPLSREEYIRQVLWSLPAERRGRRGRCAVRTACWRRNLHERGVPLAVVENALVLAAARRMMRPDGAPPLGTIRSLAYFSPVIEEVLHSPISPGYFQYLRQKIQRLTATGR